MIKLAPDKKRTTDAPHRAYKYTGPKPCRHGADSAEKHLVIDVRTNLISIYIPCNPTVGLHKEKDYTCDHFHAESDS